MEEDIKRRRSMVRMYVTYIAAAFVFGGGAALILYGILDDKHTFAQDVFNVVLPVGTAIITYWFAGRSAEKVAERPENGGQNLQQAVQNQGQDGEPLGEVNRDGPGQN